MNLSELAKVSLTKDGASALLDLPPPESVNLSGTPKQVVAVLDNLFLLWQLIVIEKAEIPIERYEWDCDEGHKHQFVGADLRGRLLLSITGYFDVLIRNYLTTKASKKSAPYPKALVVSHFRRFLPDKGEGKAEEETDSRLLWFRLQSFHYLATLFSLYFFTLFRTAPMPRPFLGPFESLAHSGLRDLAIACFTTIGQNERVAVRRLSRGVLEFAVKIYDDVPKLNKEHQPGPFSAIRLDELSLLAARDETILKRYGRKNVERVFEKQLALVMQSFGLYVISTRIGQSTIDLVCISASPTQRFTFLIEAKTTKAAYSLPKKDARALIEYVNDVKRSLSTLPPLSFVLLVSNKASKTLGDKLKIMEANASIPARFVRAQQLAIIRERIAGLLPLEVFSNKILTGSAILGDEFVDQVIKSYEAEQKAHQSFVDAMLSARGVIPPRHEWASETEHEVEKQECSAVPQAVTDDTSQIEKVSGTVFRQKR